jgi:hypothetical protein
MAVPLYVDPTSTFIKLIMIFCGIKLRLFEPCSKYSSASAVLHTSLEIPIFNFSGCSSFLPSFLISFLPSFLPPVPSLLHCFFPSDLSLQLLHPFSNVTLARLFVVAAGRSHQPGLTETKIQIGLRGRQLPGSFLTRRIPPVLCLSAT